MKAFDYKDYTPLYDWAALLHLEPLCAILLCGIYSFTISGKECFRSIANWERITGYSHPWIVKALKLLTLRGLVRKTKVANGCKYSAAIDVIDAYLDASEVNGPAALPWFTSRGIGVVKSVNHSESSELVNSVNRGSKVTLPLPVNSINPKDKDKKEMKVVAAAAAVSSPSIPVNGKKKPARAKLAPFVPPTVNEVAAYCAERGNSVDPQTFVDYNTSKDWMVGQSPMKDWRAAVRTWESRNRGTTTTGHRAPAQAPAACGGAPKYLSFEEIRNNDYSTFTPNLDEP